jgi:Short C-terminal domain
VPPGVGQREGEYAAAIARTMAGMDRQELRRRVEELKELAKSQMGRVERFGLSGALAGLAQHLGPDEQVESLFGAQIDGKQAVLALTDRRLLAAYGLVGRSYSIEYSAINQVQSGLTAVEIEGSGVSMTAKAVGRRDALLAAIQERRQRPSGPVVPAAPPTPATQDPADLLKRLGELHDAGVLTDEEFQSKKAELLDRM